MSTTVQLANGGGSTDTDDDDGTSTRERFVRRFSREQQEDESRVVVEDESSTRVVDMTTGEVQGGEKSYTIDDSPTVQERAAGARAARVTSGGIPTADEVAEETERIEETDVQLDPSGAPRTTRVSGGPTTVTVTNIEGTDASTPGDDAPEGSSEPSMADRVTRAVSGPGGEDAPNTDDGSRIPPSPGGGIAEGEILPGVHVPRVQLPNRDDLDRFADTLQLAAGAIVAGIVLWLLGNLFDVQVGGSSA